ncbi:MAG: 5-(carboxyamino)imidazole ribonucleotide mutase [Desulfovibrio sp.]|nr:5-(carboxyamino)imidazole ribonucleotide mutase [Desulfovibrio sp.]
MAQVMVIMGSLSDQETVKPCLEQLAKLGVDFAAAVSSAHRTPDRTEQLVAKAEQEGCQVFICAAGMAAHLAGAVASRTTVPVIGIPVLGQALGGMDALFSTVQMPPGYPVATVAINGARNAAFLAAEIISLKDGALRERLIAARKNMAMQIERTVIDFKD